jgi:hypothetical protein
VSVGAGAPCLGRSPSRLYLSLACAVLMLGLLPACDSKRLLLIKVDGADDLSKDVLIHSLEARTSLTGFAPGKHEDTAGDASTTDLPTIFGIYLHAHSGTITVRMFAYDFGDKLVAAGQRDVNLQDTEKQFVIDPPLWLHPCNGLSLAGPELCRPGSTPDGGDAVSPDGADVDTAALADADTDASDADAPPEDGDGPTSDERPDADGGPLDQMPDQIDLAIDEAGPDLPETEANPDQAEARADLGEASNDAPDARPIAAPDAGPISPGCQMYCTEVISACPTLFSGQPQCERACTFAQLAPGDGTIGANLGCRIDQARIAATDPSLAKDVCPGASLISLSCEPPVCSVYCILGASVCGRGLFSSDCMATCDNLVIGEIGSARSGDSLACRMSWLQDAIDDLSLCGLAVPVPTGPCQAQ